MYEENIALFIYEIEYLLYNEKAPFINDSLVSHLNSFIYSSYNKHKDLFHFLYEEELINEFIEEKYQLLTEDYIMHILINYQGMDNYLKLLENIDLEISNNISMLVQLFLEYLDEIVEIYKLNPYQYTRILQ